ALIAHELAHAAQQGAAPRIAGDGAIEEELAITPAPAGALTLMACNGDGDKDKAPPAQPTTTTPPPATTAPPAPPPPSRITKVEDVRNLHAEEDLAAEVAGGEGELAKRLRQRMAAIDGELATLKDQESDRAKKLKALKAKTLEQIIATPDTIISPDFRKDVIEAAGKLKKKQLKKEAEEKKFHRYDAFFNKADVNTALAGTGFTAADLKAFIAQESLDLVKEDTQGKIAGIAQLGPTEEKEAGGNPGDRLDPEKAILLAAKTIKIKSDRLDKLLSAAVTGDEHRRFVIASYNAGESTVAEAQRLAIAMGRPGTKWSDLTAPGAGTTPEARKKASPFYKAVVAKLSVNPDSKYHETVEQYVPRIELRTTPP
ncbi:MAG: transglycosylase SLT domain-containing protein, partial [Gemmatimonadetes bacterium]|nr:transglycosylase SLT domain-containing protein [Gemmatimonadota bacterium]